MVRPDKICKLGTESTQEGGHRDLKNSTNGYSCKN